MATIKLRSEGAVLTHNDVDANFTNLNSEVTAATVAIAADTVALTTHTTSTDHDDQYLLKDKGIDDSAVTTAITIDVDNNVGIGEAAPEAVLHIAGNVTVEGIVDGDAGDITATGDITANAFVGDGSTLTLGSLAAYNTGWFDLPATDAEFTKTHNLGTTDLICKVQLKSGTGRITEQSPFLQIAYNDPANPLGVCIELTDNTFKCVMGRGFGVWRFQEDNLTGYSYSRIDYNDSRTGYQMRIIAFRI